jgi:succinyl-CoA synthetase beta subunit
MAVPDAALVADAADIRQTLAAIPGPYMVKAQALVGGRGKAGGILPAQTAEEAVAIAGRLLGSTLRGHVVSTVLVEERRCDVRFERYLAILLDGTETLCLLGRSGGIEVEAFFGGERSSFESIPIDPRYGVSGFEIRAALERLEIPARLWGGYAAAAKSLYRAFRDSDATLAEINPLAEMEDGSLVALDARIMVDEGAFFRQPEFAKIARSRVVSDPLLSRMKELEIQYVPVGGAVGLLSSGAGVGVTIMDWVAKEGGSISAFVDLDYAIMSGRTEPAMRLVLDTFVADPAVRSIIVNFTTCGLRLDDIARSIVTALGESDARRSKPLFVHLQGNRSATAHRLLAEGGVPVCDKLGDAVRGATRAAARAVA